MQVVEVENISTLDKKILADNSLFSARIISQVGVDYLRALGISDPNGVLEEANTAFQKQQLSTRAFRQAAFSGTDKREKPVNIFAKRRSEDEDELGGDDENDHEEQKEETPALVKRYKNGGFAEARREFIDLCEDSDEPKVVRTIDMEAEKPADTGFRSLLSKSAFHPRDASAGTLPFRVVPRMGAAHPPKNERDMMSSEQRGVLNACMEGKSVFFTGSAGVGKSFTLRLVIEELKRKYGEEAVFVTASTGVAATHIGGTTLHSFAGVGLGTGDVETIVGRVIKNRNSANRWRSCRVLVIDEISMVSADFFELLDKVGQGVRGNSRPFGGIQLVLAGDFLQLPPVEKEKDVKYVMESASWKSAIDVSIELKHVFRQKGETFVELLQALRLGQVSDEHDAMLQSRVKAVLDTSNGILPTRLYTHRHSVDSENDAQLAKLQGKSYVFTAKDTGSDDYAKESLAKSAMCPTTLKLKVGAQVMLLKNLDAPSLVNGSRGKVIGFERIVAGSAEHREASKGAAPIENREYPRVEFDNGTVRTLTPESWDIERGGKILATRYQIPLCLAWALSIHKCQDKGMTIEKCEVDISAAWDAGQAYVALSRCTSLEGLSLLGYRRDKIRADPKVLEFYASMNPKVKQKQTIQRFFGK